MTGGGPIRSTHIAPTYIYELAFMDFNFGNASRFAVLSFLPHRVTLVNFQQALQYAPFFRYFLNSLSVSVVTTVVAVFIALLGAYGFSRLQFPGRKFFLTLIVYSQMFCLAAIIIPIYRIFSSSGSSLRARRGRGERVGNPRTAAGARRRGAGGDP